MGLTGPIRVASVPANHPYVRHLAPIPIQGAGRDAAGAGAITRLEDPPPNVPNPVSGQWWPPVMLEATWVADHHPDFDIAHLHFGFDAAEPDELRRWVDELVRHHRPLVMTVHDLVNPHFADQRRHAEQLDVLIPAAAEIITLTGGAAAVIQQRWGRSATVIPHPHVVPLDRLPPRQPAATTSGGQRAIGEFVIGIHAKSLRANTDPLAVLIALDRAIRELPDAVVRVDLHPDLLDRTDRTAVDFLRWLVRKEDDARWKISVHSMFSDDDLWAYLASLDLCVLPYRFGTHSGWLEACLDLGTAVLVPDIGFYAEQHGHPSYLRAADGTINQSRFTEMVRQVRHDRSLASPIRPDRWAQRAQIAAAHDRIYRSVLSRRSASRPD